LGCGATYPRVRGVLRFVAEQEYAASFGFQWNRHPRTQYDRGSMGVSESFLRSIGLTPELVAGKTVLDAGCGSGRYSDVLERWGARVIALDLSIAVDACQANLGTRAVTVLQADLMRPPLEPQSVDVAVSVGVLHHTPDAAEAFRQVARLVKPGGSMWVWFYEAYGDHSLRMQLSMLYRRVTSRMPARLLYVLCHLSVPWYYLCKIPVVRFFAARLWHISENPWWKWRVLDTFDWYSPRYQSHHRYSEVAGWFHASGFDLISVGEPPVAVGGRKR